MILLGADFFYKRGTKQDLSRKHAVQHGWFTTLLGNLSARTECGLLAWLKWHTFKHCPKAGTAESDGWLLGMIATPSAPIPISAMAVTSSCLSTRKAGNGVLSILLTLTALKGKADCCLPSGLRWLAMMPKLVRLHDPREYIKLTIGL